VFAPVGVVGGGALGAAAWDLWVRCGVRLMWILLTHTHDEQGLLTGVRPCWGRGWGGLGCCCLGPVGVRWCKIEVQVNTPDVRGFCPCWGCG